MKLLDLPTDIVYCVLDYLPQSSILNVTLTCKSLHDIAERQLYCEYSNTHLGGPSFVPFIRRLLERPERAKYVQTVHLRSWKDFDSLAPIGNYQIDPSKLSLSPSDYLLFAGAAKSAGIISSILPYDATSYIFERIEKLSPHNVQLPPDWFADIPYDDRFCQLLRTGIDDPFVVILMSLATHAREFCFYAVHWSQQTLLRQAPLPNSGTLKKLTAAACVRVSPWPLALFNNTLQRGNVETLEACGAGSWWQDLTSWQMIPSPVSLPYGLVALNKLVLRHCTFTLADLKTLLGACTMLRSFYFSVGGCRVGLHSFTSTELIEALLPYRKTIEYLFLDMSNKWNFGYDNDKIQSLAAFEALKTVDTVSADWDNLVSFGEDDQAHIPEVDRLCHRLPSSVQHVLFRDPEGVLRVGQLGSVMLTRDAKFPNLRLITIMKNFPESAASTVEYDAIVDRASPLGPFQVEIISSREYRKRYEKNAMFAETGWLRSTHGIKWAGDRYVNDLPERVHRRRREIADSKNMSPLDPDLYLYDLTSDEEFDEGLEDDSDDEYDDLDEEE